MKKLLLALIFIFSFLSAEEIRSYKIDNSIKDDGSVKIVEEISYYFDTPRHGIYRDIPVVMKVHNKLQNIKLNLDYIMLNGKSVNYERSVVYKNGVKNISFKIGSADKLLKGVQKYTIAYSLDNIVIKDCYSNKDCISLNSIGTAWRVPIKNIVANYYLPPILADKVELKVYTGKFGSTSSKAKVEWIDNSFLKVKLNYLKPYEGLTTTFVYPKGLIETPLYKRVLNYLYLPFFIALFAYLFKLYKQFRGFEDNRSIAVMYEPPKDISVLESGLILDTNADNKDYAAAIIELANRGYLRIYKTKDMTTLEKIEKNTKSLPYDLELFYNLLFKDSNLFILNRSDSVAKELQEIFSKVNEVVYDESVQREYFKEKPYESKKRFLLKTAPFALIFFVYALYYVVSSYGIDAAILLIFPFVFTTVAISIFMNSEGIFEKFIALLFFAIGAFMPLIGYFGTIDEIKNLVFSPVGFSYLIVIFLIFTYNRVGRYTQKGAYLKTKLLGLKEFIVRVKEDEIRRRLKSDPLYLERLLPYAILFGVNKHWIELFTKFNVSPPIWYDGDLEDLSHFDSDFSLVSTPSSSGSSSTGFGGGGFSSGGGAGGGGGGSW